MKPRLFAQARGATSSRTWGCCIQRATRPSGIAGSSKDEFSRRPRFGVGGGRSQSALHVILVGSQERLESDRMRRLKVAADSLDPVNLESPDPLSDDLEHMTSRLQERAESMRAWLDERHGSSLDRRAHLEEGSEASGHWHAGYLSALDDAIALLTGWPRSHTPGMTPRRVYQRTSACNPIRCGLCFRLCWPRGMRIKSLTYGLLRFMFVGFEPSYRTGRLQVRSDVKRQIKVNQRSKRKAGALVDRERTRSQLRRVRNQLMDDSGSFDYARHNRRRRKRANWRRFLSTSCRSMQQLCICALLHGRTDRIDRGRGGWKFRLKRTRRWLIRLILKASPRTHRLLSCLQGDRHALLSRPRTNSCTILFLMKSWTYWQL